MTEEDFESTEGETEDLYAKLEWLGGSSQTRSKSMT